MKILKEGQIPDMPEKTTIWYKVTCGNCGTSVTFNELDKDVAFTKIKDLDGENEYNGYNFKCPLCEEQIEGILKYVQYACLPTGQEPDENTQWLWPYDTRTIGTIGTGIGVLDFSKTGITETHSYNCETCPVNPWKKNNGKTIVGDTPCNWCPKMIPTILSSSDK